MLNFDILKPVKQVAAVFLLALALTGAWYGLWQARIASQRLVEIGRLSEAVREQETALRASHAAAGAVAKRLRAAEQLNKEKADDARLDQEAAAAVPDWADASVPAAVRDRLRDD